MSTNLVDAIQTRLESMGKSQAQFAECVNATSAQRSIFLRENLLVVRQKFRLSLKKE